MTFEPDMFGAPKSSFSASKRLGNDQSRLSQIVDGKWKVVSDYNTPTETAGSGGAPKVFFWAARFFERQCASASAAHAARCAIR